MKKWLAFALALVMLFSLCGCPKTDDPKATDNSAPSSAPSTPNNNSGGTTETGNFSVLTETVLSFVDGDDSETMKYEFVYDDAYNLIGCKLYAEGALMMESTFDKDPNTPLTLVNYDEDGTVCDRTEYTYDENSNVLTERYYFDEELMTEAIYTYDDHGNVLTKYYDNGEEDWTETYENNYENGVLTEVKIYSHDALQERFLYDSDGNELLHSYYYDGEEGSRYESTYENGKLVLCVDYSDGKETSREEYTYNNSGKRLTRTISSDGVVHHQEERVYDADDQLIEVKYLNDDDYSANTVIGYEDGSFVSVKLYDEGELEGDYTFTYEKANVSEEQAQILTEFYNNLLAELADL